jgi:DeoR/GlpR family transcriptional regulator of sugar metabolism
MPAFRLEVGTSFLLQVKIQKNKYRGFASMEMTIKQLAGELNVSKSTVSRAIVQLGFQNKLRRAGNKYLLSETQISLIKQQISKNAIEKTLQGEAESHHAAEKSLQGKAKSHHAAEKSLQGEAESLHTTKKTLQEEDKTVNVFFQEQLSILNEQLSIKDHQIQILQEQISQLTTAMESMATALTAAQALHAGTIQKQLTQQNSTIEEADPEESEQQKKKKGFFSRIFGSKTVSK